MKRTLALCISGIMMAFMPVMSLKAQQEGDSAPDFTFTDLEGNSVSLSDYQGKVVFLFLFGNGCPYCKAIGNDTETKINQVYGPDENFQALGLDLWNSSSSVATVSAFRDFTGITYPLLLQAGDVTGSYSTTYDRVIVVDTQGNIAYKGTEPASGGDLDNAIEVIDGLIMSLSANLVSIPDNFFGDLYPNPSKESSTIEFRLGKPEHIRADLLDITGQSIKILADQRYAAGDHILSVGTSGINEGIYFLQIISGQQQVTRRLAVIRQGS